MFRQFGEPLQHILNTLPQEYLGYRWQMERPRTSLAVDLDAFVEEIAGHAAPPDDPFEWLHIPEEYLFELTPNRVFHDAAGETTRRFASFVQYPEDVWKHRLCACLNWMIEWGVKHPLGDYIPAIRDTIQDDRIREVRRFVEVVPPLSHPQDQDRY